jgi:hypothetical protein
VHRLLLFYQMQMKMPSLARRAPGPPLSLIRRGRTREWPRR